MRICDAREGLSETTTTRGHGRETAYTARELDVEVIRCHNRAVKRIVTEDSPDIFLTVSEVCALVCNVRRWMCIAVGASHVRLVYPHICRMGRCASMTFVRIMCAKVTTALRRSSRSRSTCRRSRCRRLRRTSSWSPESRPMCVPHLISCFENFVILDVPALIGLSLRSTTDRTVPPRGMGRSAGAGQCCDVRAPLRACNYKAFDPRAYNGREDGVREWA